jgi:capsule polysaccharide export protein KpsE/RkpR
MRLDQNTSISEDRKSGIITISVTDVNPQRAAALATEYVDQLNFLVAELSTSAAHRERVFLEDRLKVVKQELDDAANQLAEFSSKNNTIDIQQEGKAIVEAAANLAGQMIAAQSQLEGLRQIYTDSNPRVQSLNARVAELRKQLQKIAGTTPESSKGPGHAVEQVSEMPYPSIRNLPLLGVKYADHFRHAKIQETVYELLTGQYELAKVQEAKETPSIKVLDVAKIPDKKSFPPRIVVILLGTFLAVALSTIWVLGSAEWDDVAATDPRKVFAQEVAETVKARLHWGLASQNGNSGGSRTQEFWTRLGGRRSAAVVSNSENDPLNTEQ